jgi:hypothetical protein
MWNRVTGLITLYETQPAIVIERFRRFPQALQVNARIVPWNRPLQFSSFSNSSLIRHPTIPRYIGRIVGNVVR